MKKTLTILLCLSLQLFISGGKAQEVLHGVKQILDISMDDLGNADVAATMKLNASQWDMFKKNIGSNTSILKRSMEKSMPKYYLTNFNYSEDAMERTYTMKFKVLGLCTTNKNGKWEGKLESKNPDVTKLSDREFVMTADIMSNGMLIQQTQKLHLPANASGAKIENDSFGKAIMTYSTGSGFLPGAITATGILLIAAGCWIFYRNQTAKINNLKVAKESVAA